MIKLHSSRGEIEPSTLRFLLTGSTSNAENLPNPAPDWLGQKEWQEVTSLSRLQRFSGLDEHFSHDVSILKHINDSATAFQEPLGQPWDDELTAFERLCVLRCLQAPQPTPFCYV